MISGSQSDAISTNEDAIGSRVDILSGLTLGIKRYNPMRRALAHAQVSASFLRLKLFEKVKGCASWSYLEV